MGAALVDINKPEELISTNMTAVLTVYSLLFMRFAWMVRPRNYILLACHTSNEAAQLYTLQRKLAWEARGGKAGDAQKAAAAKGALH